jgi:hypothetical protein
VLFIWPNRGFPLLYLAQCVLEIRRQLREWDHAGEVGVSQLWNLIAIDQVIDVF